MNEHYMFQLCSATAFFASKLRFMGAESGGSFQRMRSDSGIGGGGVVDPDASERCTITVSAQRPER